MTITYLKKSPKTPSTDDSKTNEIVKGLLKEMVKGTEKNLTQTDIDEIEKTLPVGWAHGDRYSDIQWIGPERYC